MGNLCHSLASDGADDLPEDFVAEGWSTFIGILEKWSS